MYDITKFKLFPYFKENFLSYFPKNTFKEQSADKCWKWKGPIQSNGYGHITWTGNIYLAHRLSYLIFNGKIDADKIIMHTCDNRACVNPKHLVIGTQSDNCIDMIQKGNFAKAKLNEEAVKVIRWILKYENKRGLASKLANLYGISPTTVFNIKTNKIWSWVIV